nr:extracellular solute-binding protein [Pseudomonas sp. sia0905]
MKFLVPEEGGLLTVDSWAIPKNAKQPELAYRFIDYMLDARNARLNSEATHFYAPLRSDLPEMLELAKQSAELVPPPVERRRLYFLEPGAQQMQVINQQWQAIRLQYQQQQRP